MTAVKQTFRESFKISTDLLKWYPGHMEKSLVRMQKIVKVVDCIVEVHDARIPFSGRNPQFIRRLLGTKPHILILNKVDLIERKHIKTIHSKMEENGIENVLFTNCLNYQNCSGIKKVVPRAIDLISQSNRFNRSEERDLIMMVIGIPNVGKSTLINVLRHRNLNRPKASPVGAQPGVTKSVLNKIRINLSPDMYLIDTPGILSPKVSDSEIGLKLALCSCIKESIIGEYAIADFLLYWLNKTHNYKYVEEFKLEAPTDEILTVLKKIAVENNYYKKIKNITTNNIVTVPDIQKAAKVMIKFFRNGKFGLINLDSNMLL